MKKLIAILLCLMMVLSLLAGCGGEAKSDYESIKERGTLKIGITNFAPMDYPDGNGGWSLPRRSPPIWGFRSSLWRSIGITRSWS